MPPPTSLRLLAVLAVLALAPVGSAQADQAERLAAQSVPPFDAAERSFGAGTLGGVIASIQEGQHRRALDTLEAAIARSPRAGDLDYLYGWAARAAAAGCRRDDALVYYRVMRRHFDGRLDHGARSVGGQPHRDWDDHLHVTRAYAAFCEGSGPAVRAMRAADAAAREVAPLDRYTNLSRSDSITVGLAPPYVYAHRLPPRAAIPDRPDVPLRIRVLGSWRYDPGAGAWRRETTASPPLPPTLDGRRATLDSLVLAALAPDDGWVAAIWTASGLMRWTERRVGAPDCTFYGTRADLDRLAYGSSRRIECLPTLGRAGGLTAVPLFRWAVRPDSLPDIRAASRRLVEGYAGGLPDTSGIESTVAFAYDDGEVRLVARGPYGRSVTLSIAEAYRYVPATRQWVDAPEVTGGPLRVPSLCDYVCRSIAPFAPSRPDEAPRLADLTGGPVPVGYYFARVVVDGRPQWRTLFLSPLSCTDLMIGPAPPGEFATCVPGGGATFVPFPPGWDEAETRR